MTEKKGRPLWRISSKALVEELERRGVEIVPILTAALQRRGYVILPPAETGDAPFNAEAEETGTPEQVEAWDKAFNRPPVLGPRWPPMGDGDE